jgi:hypothetical protein
LRAVADLICTSEVSTDAYLRFGIQHRAAVLAIAEALMITARSMPP